MPKEKFVIVKDYNGFSLTEEKFKTKKDIVKRLASFHDVDFTGCIDKNGIDIEVSLYEFLKQFKTTEQKLNYLLDYGMWDIEKI